MKINQNDLNNIQTLIKKGKFDSALDGISKIHSEIEVISVEQQSQILYFKAVCLRLKKEHDAALKCLQELLTYTPEAARAYQEKGYNFSGLGNTREAAISFYKATQLNPALLSSWQALIPIYQQQNQKQAEDIAKKRIEELNDLPKQLFTAQDLMYDGKLNSADQLCRQYLKENKHSIDGLLLLAEIALKLNANPEAEFILETCVELSPENSECHYKLFNIYSKLGKFDAALITSEKLLNLNSNNTFYRLAKAKALVGVGKIEDAIKLYLSIVDKHASKVAIYMQLGHAYKTQGNMELAIKSYQQAYTCQYDYGDAYWSLANTKTYTFTDTEISNMLRFIDDENVSIEDKIHVEFALGKAYEDKKLFNDSFHHYKSGNQLKSLQIQYSVDKQNSFVERQIDVFTPEFTKQFDGQGHQDNAPIFIVGLPRSGSTLLEQILASHSMVDGTMELHEVLSLAAQLSHSTDSQHSYPMSIANLPKEMLRQLGQRFIKNTKVYRQGAPFFIDKMPNNFLHIGLIKAILPNAKIIDARRDPMACCFSGYKQLFGEGQEFTYGLDSIAKYYQNYLKLMNHWQTLYPDQILLVQHEDIVNNTEVEVRRLLDFCGLAFEQSCLDFHKNKRAVKTPSSQQVRQPIYKSGLEQWKNYESHLDELKATLGIL